MTSEIRTNSLKSRAGLSTVTLTDSGPMFSGITTFVDNSGFNIGTGSSIFSPATNTLTFGTNSNERIRINSSGNVGLGVNNPTRKLDVSGDVLGNAFMLRGNTSASPSIQAQMFRPENNTLAFATDGNNERLRIDSVGRVIIANGGSGGTADVNADNFVVKNYTSSGSCGISILNADNLNSTLYFGNASDTKHAEIVWSDASNLFLIGTSNAGASIKFRTADQSDALTIDSNGNFGFGDTAPANFTGYTNLSIHGSTGGAITFGDDGTDEWEIYGGDGVLKIYDRTNTAERLRITSDGRTLINTTAVTNTNDQLTVKRPASSFGEMSMTVDANTTTGTHANAFIFTKSKNTYWNGLGFQSSHGHIGAIVGMRDSTGMNASHKMRIEIGGTGINASEEKTWDFLNTGNLSISDGDLVVASGHGIDFSATSNAGNSASMGSELFDDYEEGSWTPHLVSSAGNMSTTSFTLHQGYYTKVGRLVYITGVMYGPRSSGGTGNLRISNLPYTVRNGDHAQLLTKDYQLSNYPTNFGHISGYGMQNTTQINLFKREGSSQAGLPLSWWSTSANDYMYFNLTYTTDT